MCQLVGEISGARQQHSHLLMFPGKYRSLPYPVFCQPLSFLHCPSLCGIQDVEMKGKSRRRASKGKKSSELDAQTTREIINSKILKEHCSCIRCLPVCFCLLSSSLKQSLPSALLWGSLGFTGFHSLQIFFGILEAPMRELRKQDCLSSRSGYWILIFQVQLKGLCGLAPWVGRHGQASFTSRRQGSVQTQMCGQLMRLWYCEEHS